MKRSVALFVALALLIAHALAIHATPSGDLAPPYDTAFAAYRVGSTLVHQGYLGWGPESGGLESYPSFLWVLITYVIERSYLSINHWAQLVGGACAMATVLLTSRFHSDRVASLIAPFLLAISGSFAAAALSGTETALVALLFTAGFVANERGWSKTFGLSLALAGLARPEAWLLTPLYFAQRYLPWLKHGTDRGPRVNSYLYPVGAFLALALLRRWLGGDFVSGFTAGLLTFEGQSMQGVGEALRDFLISSVSPLLLIYTIWYLFRRRLSVTGRRGLFLTAGWILLAATRETESLPFNESMVPVLPVLLIAVQEGLINALNSTRGWVRQFAWASFFLAGLLTILASRVPDNVGSFPFARYQYKWLQPSQGPRLGERGWLGRPGLVDEIEKTQFLRATGIFLREGVDANVTVLTPWPGAIGYLSRLDVRDLRGRATALMGEDRLRSWRRPGRTDLVAALRMGAGYVIPTCRATATPPTPSSLATAWIVHLDEAELSDTERLSEVIDALGQYELITVPLPSPSRTSSKRFHGKAYLLRNKDLDQAPELQLRVEGDTAVVTCTHVGHAQLADLRLTLKDEEDGETSITPVGNLSPDRVVLARKDLLLTRTGARAVELMRLKLPEDAWRGKSLNASLLNPGSRGSHPFTQVSPMASIQIP